MSKIKVAVIGCGCIARSAHIPCYMEAQDAEIKYFCDIIPEKAQSCVDEYGCGAAITDYKIALQDPEVEAVSVCTPNLMHSVISIDAMRAGKHVLCEKPAARIYSEALEMQKVQRETGKVLNIGVVCRFHEAVNQVRQKILDGELGEVYHVFINFRVSAAPLPQRLYPAEACSSTGAYTGWIRYCTAWAIRIRSLYPVQPIPSWVRILRTMFTGACGAKRRET